MNASEEALTPEESLQVIRTMIESTKSSISDNSHFFLLWGWTTFFGCLIQYSLLVIARSPYHFLAWLVTPVALIIHLVFIFKYKRRERVKTFIGETMGFVWAIIGASYFVLAIVFSKIGWQYCFPFYITLYGIGTYISGSLLKLRPMKIGGSICMILVAIAPFLEFSLQIVLSAFAILISYIIPGYILRNQYRNTKKIR